MVLIRPKPGTVGSLFSGHHEPTGWVAPAELPDLSAYPKHLHFGFDTEYKRYSSIFDTKMAGLSVCTPDKKTFYFPVAHRGGGNIDENAVKRWAKNELAGRHLSILNAKDDVQVCKDWGLDLEDIDCKLHDPAFKAALLDENRRKFNLNILSQELLGKTKAESPGDKADIFDCSASEIGPYAEIDALLHYEIDVAQQPEIDKQDLTAVCDLEDQLIYSTCAMERAGARIDRPKLERWIKEVELAHQTAILFIYKETGLNINPNSGKDLRKLFSVLNISVPVRLGEGELDGQETFEDVYLSKVTHSAVRAAIAARKLHSLNSKYLTKYLKLLDFNNIIRYTLHQLRGDEYGTVTGRYASSGGTDRRGINIQQVMKVESQLEEEEIMMWIVRELFIPADGKVYVAADASQIEFRWFAHYSKSERLIKEYNENPEMDFHQLVANMLGQKRKDAKHNNFGKLYTMGIPKLARKLGCPCSCGCAEGSQWRRANHSPDCKIQKAFDISAEYDAKFPEAKTLSEQAMKVAKERGFVHTRMMRRRRYPTGERLHSALNAVIQGTAAETLKVKILETYNNRKQVTITMRAPVHDEIDGDLENPEKKKDFKELLEAPDSRISCRVPLLWDVATGANWRECTE
jgi:DNA polymerase-1